MTRPLSLSLIPFTLLALVAAAAPGCDSTPAEQHVDVARSSLSRVTDPQVSATDSATFATDNEAFALAAYRALAADGGNLIFSPASISIALAMAYAGAAGSTATEMATALHFTLPPERLHPAFDALDLALSARGEGKLGADGGPMRLHVVNSAWAERTYTFESTYLDILAGNYGAGINLVDFLGAAESARLTINAWVEDQTEDKIKDLLPAGSVDSATRLVLVNAVYFNAAWLYPFDPNNTHNGNFTLLDNSTVTANFMGAHLSMVPAVRGADFSAVSLPYQDDRLSLLVVVPDAGSFAAFEASLDAAKLDDIVAGLTSQPVNLGMPRFRIETGKSLAVLLQGLGMTSAFAPGLADFSGMDGTQSLFISDVIHKAFIDVAEKGTEAAAATAVVLSGSAAPTGLQIYADHPFLCFLRDQPTGTILFMGRVMDPSK
jgi:serpin B